MKSTTVAGRKGCWGEILPGRKGMRNRCLELVGVCLQFRPLVQLIDKGTPRIPSDRNLPFGFSGPKEPQEGHPRRGHGPKCSLHTAEIFLPEGWERLDTRPAPEIGVCPLKGKGCPTSSPVLDVGSLRVGVQLHAPSLGRCSRPRPARRPEQKRSRVWSPGAEKAGWVGEVEPSHGPRDSDLRVGPRLHRRCRRPSVASVPAAAAAAAAAAGLSLQTLALLRSHRHQRSLNSHCSRLLSPARRSGSRSSSWPRQLPVPAAPTAPPCSSTPLANRRRCRRRRQGSDCLRQPGTGRLRPAPRPRPLCLGPPPAARPFFGRRLRPLPRPSPTACRPVAACAWVCAAAGDRLLCTAGRPL